MRRQKIRPVVVGVSTGWRREQDRHNERDDSRCPAKIARQPRPGGSRTCPVWLDVPSVVFLKGWHATACRLESDRHVLPIFLTGCFWQMGRHTGSAACVDAWGDPSCRLTRPTQGHGTFRCWWRICRLQFPDVAASRRTDWSAGSCFPGQTPGVGRGGNLHRPAGPAG